MGLRSRQADPIGRKRTEIPIYSFEKHQRLDETTTIYSPHVLILEGIFALYDQRVMDLMDMKVICRRHVPYRSQPLTNLQIYCEADADTCLSRRSMAFNLALATTLLLTQRLSSSSGRQGQRKDCRELRQAVVRLCKA